MKRFRSRDSAEPRSCTKRIKLDHVPPPATQPPMPLSPAERHDGQAALPSPASLPSPNSRRNHHERLASPFQYGDSLVGAWSQASSHASSPRAAWPFNPADLISRPPSPIFDTYNANLGQQVTEAIESHDRLMNHVRRRWRIQKYGVWVADHFEPGSTPTEERERHQLREQQAVLDAEVETDDEDVEEAQARRNDEGLERNRAQVEANGEGWERDRAQVEANDEAVGGKQVQVKANCEGVKRDRSQVEANDDVVGRNRAQVEVNDEAVGGTRVQVKANCEGLERHRAQVEANYEELEKDGARADCLQTALAHPATNTVAATSLPDIHQGRKTDRCRLREALQGGIQTHTQAQGVF